MWIDLSMQKSLSERRRGLPTIHCGTQSYLGYARFGLSGGYKHYTGGDDRLWLLGVLVIISVLGAVYLVGAAL